MPGLSLLEIITIIAAFQLLMLGFVMLSKRSRKKQSNRILALFMFSNALVLIHFVSSIMGIFRLTIVPIFYYLLAPLIYLYVKSMCSREFRLNPRHFLHGAVFFIMILYAVVVPVFLLNGDAEQGLYYLYIIPQVILHLQIAPYILLSFITIHKYRKEIKNHFSSVERISLSWLLLIIMAFTLMWLTDVVSFMLDLFAAGTEAVSYYLILSSVTINLLFANYLVYKGLQQPDVFSGLKEPEKYSGSRISESDSLKIVNQLKAFMQNEKPFLNPDLSIKDLAEHFTIHPKFLSQVINSRFGQNFYDFVNYYRIEEAKEIITNNSDEKKTILEVAYEVGFNSKSAFNNAFKKNTGKTPTHFKKTG